MSKVHIGQIRKRLVDLFENKIDMSDQKNGSEIFEDVFHSRSLAAYAIYHLSGCQPELAAKAITDGGGDNGIDAIYYDSSENKIYIVQSKWIKNGVGEPDNASIKKFIAGVKDLLDLDFSRFNSKINEMSVSLSAAIETVGNQIVLALVHTGSSELSEISRRDFSDLLSEINDINDEAISYQAINQKLLHKSLTDDLSSPISTDLVLKYWGKVQDPHKAFYGQISALEVGQLWVEHGERLVAKNLRGSLGSTDVNDGIKDSLKNNPNLFWYFNNGITAIANKVDKTLKGGSGTDIGIFKCEGIQVINGAQTLSTIGRFINSSEGKGLDQCFVQIRIISLDDADGDFDKQVTKNNNRQNRIESRDFVAQDKNQVRIKTELSIDNVNYQIMRSHEFVRTESSFDLVDATTALVCASGNWRLVAVLKASPQRLWEDTSKSPYVEIFNKSISGSYLWMLVQCQKHIDEKLVLIANGLKIPRHKRAVSYGNRLIASLVFSQLPLAALKKEAKPFDKDEVFNEIDILCDEFSKLVYNYVYRWHRERNIPPIFRNQEKCVEMCDKILRERKNP